MGEVTKIMARIMMTVKKMKMIKTSDEDNDYGRRVKKCHKDEDGADSREEVCLISNGIGNMQQDGC